MGLLVEGHPLEWPDSLEVVKYVKEHGLIQLLNIYHNIRERKGDCLKWGDEVEMELIKFNDEEERVRLCLRGKEVLEGLTKPEMEAKQSDDPTAVSRVKSLWRPEYGRYMIEGTTGRPYGGESTAFGVVEANMRLRREEVNALLKPGEAVVSLGGLPMHGVGDFAETDEKPHGDVAQSHFLPDSIINEHPRFPYLTRNIRLRRGEKVCINLPLYMDENTTEADNTGVDGKVPAEAKPGHVYLDAMGFGMGLCCLQVTFQAQTIDEARKVYDQLTVVCPLMLALTASTPIHRGHLTDIDVRWSSISGSVDDRTREERGLAPLKDSQHVIPKSRYASVSFYLSRDPLFKPAYNDLDVRFDPAVQKQLIDGGMDPVLAKHFAHLFIRDPLVIYQESVEQDDAKSSEHFENIQSTNWQTMRFKPPPPGSNIGWRVEFRPMEVQISDFENAAYTVFLVLLTRVILSFNLNLYIPLSLVDENMERAHNRDAVNRERFYFRKHVTQRPENASKMPDAVCVHDDTDEYEEYSLNEIINGKKGEFAGLMSFVRTYLNTLTIDLDTRLIVEEYLELISKRASGELQTNAAWIRNFVMNHPNYKKDSKVDAKINYDLVKEAWKIGEGLKTAPEMNGNLNTNKFRKTHKESWGYAPVPKNADGGESSPALNSALPE